MFTPLISRSRDLPSALLEAEELRKQMREWPPRPEEGTQRSLSGVMDDEMGWVD